jgi:ABC-type Fe3+-hydroxamate transport system substrate-binding protein
MEGNMRDKRAKFVELANKRVNKAIAQLRLVGNLSNKSAYEFIDDDARKIIKALQKEIDTLKAKFSDGVGNDGNDFQL